METLQSWGIGLAVTVVLGLFAKFCPRAKLQEWLKPPMINIGRGISKFLILRLGKKSADKVEEGIIVTVLDVLGYAPLYIRDGLLEDNETKKEKAKDASKKKEDDS